MPFQFSLSILHFLLTILQIDGCIRSWNVLCFPKTGSFMKNSINRLTLHIHVARLQTLDSNWNTELFRTPFRVIPYSRLYLPVEGEGEILLNNVRSRLTPGKLVLVPPYSRINVSCPNSLTKYWCHFNAFHMDTEFDYFSMFGRCLEKEIDDLPFYSKLFRIITAGYSVENALLAPVDLLKTHAALNLLAFFLEAKPDRMAKDLDRLVSLLNHIEKNLHTRLDCPSLAAVCGLNPTYLTNLFKTQMGLPLIQYVSRRKLSKAAEYLVNSGYSMCEIAEKIGIGSVEHFSRKFKSAYGVSPLEWRRAAERNRSKEEAEREP